MASQPPMIVYNLFPRLVGSFDHWMGLLDHIRNMGFNWIYVNPFHLPGASGSLYAVKDYFLYHPLFSVGSMDFSRLHEQKGIGDLKLKQFLDAAHARGLKVMMDLVVNHTATDSPLVKQHPGWYRWSSHGRIVHPGAKHGRKRVVWGDLARLDHRKKPTTAGLQDYLAHMVRHYVWMGFDGFRCDAAYQVPSTSWRGLIKAARSMNKHVVFLAETLGCSWKQTQRIARAGFHFVFNNFCWWDLQEPSFYGALNSLPGKAGSIAFPESHDTERLASNLHGNKGLILQRYALASFSSAGVMMPLGFEWGARRKPDVLRSMPSDREAPAFDLSQDVAYINRLKSIHPVFQAEGRMQGLNVGPGLSGFVKEANGQRAVVLAHVRGGAQGVALELSRMLPRPQVIYGLRRLEQGWLRAELVPGEVFVAVSPLS